MIYKKEDTDPSLVLLTEKEAAELLGLTTRTLITKRNKGEAPAFIKLDGKNIRYRLSSLMEYLDKWEHKPEGINNAGYANNGKEIDK